MEIISNQSQVYETHAEQVRVDFSKKVPHAVTVNSWILQNTEIVPSTISLVWVIVDVGKTERYTILFDE